MEIAQVGKIIWQRFSVSSFITFGLCLVLTITILHFDARNRKTEEKSTANRFLSKKSLDDKAVHTPRPVPGSLYTRWGRTKCTRNSSLVYDGVVGGTAHNATGGGSNLLCLPNDPIWANYTGVFVGGGSHIYGSEYQTSNSYLKEHFSFANAESLSDHNNRFLFKKSLDDKAVHTPKATYWSHMYGSEYETRNSYAKKYFSFANAESLFDHNVPCAVCLTRQPAVVMMLPARTKCYDGWTIEYSGYLMTEYHNHKGRHEYVCVDYAPEADPAGYRNENGALLYFVKGICGSLPCPPYVYGRILTCVVCSKY
ncbi:uncharacterized protein LOC115221573 [Octopus sinensis]|uniref:Uncharacterized protein LOC115221573 n=1 Tax=Octopus sinensis TaxID=2607531 RepID=A0A7E6FGC2_9MOLL|nr:uncharacterized protein LOC115221573 [Octopus sinensis]